MKVGVLYIFACLIAGTAIISSCKKENKNDIAQFYGKWETSYGDTITFYRENNKNMVSYNNFLSATVPNITEQEYSYQNAKLGIKNGFNGPGKFYFFESFRWIQNNKVFEVQGVQWHPFISSTVVYFTFTKIQ